VSSVAPSPCTTLPPKLTPGVIVAGLFRLGSGGIGAGVGTPAGHGDGVAVAVRLAPNDAA